MSGRGVHRRRRLLYLFDKGVIVGEGTYATLMKDCPAYMALLNGEHPAAALAL